MTSAYPEAAYCASGGKQSPKKILLLPHGPPDLVTYIYLQLFTLCVKTNKYTILGST